MKLHKRSIVISGSIAQQPGMGGLTWVYLQYIRGFQRLGFDVHFIDRIDPDWCVDRTGQPTTVETSENLRYVTGVSERFGLRKQFALLKPDGQDVCGASRGELVERLHRADFLLNINGFLNDPELAAAARRRVFLDIDPGFLQIWRQQGLADVFAGHDDFVTIGENIGQSDCDVPTCGMQWITTPQPVVLADWPVCEGGAAYTSVISWRGLFGPLEHQGRRLGLRVHEFRKFVELPRRIDVAFELALDIPAADERDRAALIDNRWQIVSPRAVAGDPWKYRRFIQASKSEFLVAKEAYVATRSGWLSDRSLCYLASGKPVVAQDTGFSRRYSTTAGLLGFTTLDEAVEQVRAVEADYRRHCRAARQVAEEHFDSDLVLTRLLQRLGIPSSRVGVAGSDRGVVDSVPATPAKCVRRLNWGCGAAGEPGWINSDRKAGPHVDLPCDIREGLALADDSIDYIVSVHALQEIPLAEIVATLAELRRVLRPEGILRLVLPDLDRGIAAYLQQDRDYFLVPDDDARSLGGKFITQLIWYGYTRTLFTYDFVEELLQRAGFPAVRRCTFHQSPGPFPEIVELDNRESESLFVEAVK